MIELLKKHWDWPFAAGGMLATLTVTGTLGVLIGFFTLALIACRVAIYIIKLRMTWRNRNNTNFFIRQQEDDEDTET